jgi:hypothetical protein
MTLISLSLLAALLSIISPTVAKDWLSPEYKWLYEKPLVIPPIKTEKLYNPGPPHTLLQ